jgi:hypothetical protein
MKSVVTVVDSWSDEEFELSRRWGEVRDTFLGQNYVTQDVKKALVLAATCKHPEARWLTALFEGRKVANKFEANEVLESAGVEDATALCFSSLTCGLRNRDVLLESANRGCALAQAEVAKLAGNGRVWAQKAADQGEREGFLTLGEYCDFCEDSQDEAKRYFAIASKLGSVDAMALYGNMLPKSDPLRHALRGKAAASGYLTTGFLNDMEEQMEGMRQSFLPKIVFALGRALDGHVNEQRREIFGNGLRFSNWFPHAKVVVEFYKIQALQYRRAVDMWTLVGLRRGVVKDVRIFIGKLIWKCREEAQYAQ